MVNEGRFAHEGRIARGPHAPRAAPPSSPGPGETACGSAGIAHPHCSGYLPGT